MNYQSKQKMILRNLHRHYLNGGGIKQVAVKDWDSWLPYIRLRQKQMIRVATISDTCLGVEITDKGIHEVAAVPA